MVQKLRTQLTQSEHELAEAKEKRLTALRKDTTLVAVVGAQGDGAEIARLTTQLATAQQAQRDTAGMAEDGAMLHWLEEQRADVLCDSEPGGTFEVCIDTWHPESGYNHFKLPRGTAKSLREAIRAAMNAALPKGRL